MAAVRAVTARILLSLAAPAAFLLVWGLLAQRLGNDIILPGVSQVGGILLSPQEALYPWAL